MVVEWNGSLLVRMKLSQLKPATNMQLPSCEHNLNKSGHVDAATQRPGQTEHWLVNHKQKLHTWLPTSHLCLLSTSLPAKGQSNGQIQTSVKRRWIVPLFSLVLGMWCVWFINYFMFAILTLWIRPWKRLKITTQSSRWDLSVTWIYFGIWIIELQNHEGCKRPLRSSSLKFDIPGFSHIYPHITQTKAMDVLLLRNALKIISMSNFLPVPHCLPVAHHQTCFWVVLGWKSSSNTFALDPRQTANHDRNWGA